MSFFFPEEEQDYNSSGKENESPESPPPVPVMPPSPSPAPFPTYSSSMVRRSRSSQLLNRSMRNRQSRKKCVICKRKFRDSHELRIHLQEHKGERPFGCTICGKGFFRKQNLSGHLRNKHGITLEEMPIPRPWAPWLENDTDTDTDIPRSRSRRRRSPTPDEDSGPWIINPPDKSIIPIGVWYLCKVCHKCIQDKKRFIDHKNSHTQEEIDRSEQIPTIDLGSSDEEEDNTSVAGGSVAASSIRSGRSEDARSHRSGAGSNAGAYQQSRADGGRRHSMDGESIGSHSDFRGPPPEFILSEETFQCNLCPKHYNFKGNLLYHQAVHHHAKQSPKGVKMYRCSFEDCSKKFMNKKLLQGHFFNHTGESRFKCPECGEGFIFKPNYISHSLEKHPRDQ